MLSQKFSFWTAVIININIVIGAAFFLGAQEITINSGLLAPAVWFLCGILLLPLMAVFARFAHTYPQAGGIYIYSQKSLGDFWGFLSGWGYFIGTMAGNAAVLHAFSSYLQKVDYMQPFLQNTGLIGLNFDVLLAIFFMLMSLADMQFLSNAQRFFALTKMIPLLVIILGVFFLGSYENISMATISLDGFSHSIPMAFFAYIGVEACCAVADKIKGARRADSVIWISFIIIMSIYVVLQFFILAMQGQANMNPFLNVLPMLTSNSSIIFWGNRIIYLSILLSFLGGFYGMFVYNSWNMYAIAKDRNIIGETFFLKLNNNGVPWICVLLQGFLLVFFLVVTSANHYLITISDFGIIIAYLLSAVAAIYTYKSSAAFLSIGSCCALIYFCFSDLLTSGFMNTLPFAVIMLIGVIGFFLRKKEN